MIMLRLGLLEITQHGWRLTDELTQYIEIF